VLTGQKGLFSRQQRLRLDNPGIL